jgi:hypothetical protein
VTLIPPTQFRNHDEDLIRESTYAASVYEADS